MCARIQNVDAPVIIPLANAKEEKANTEEQDPTLDRLERGTDYNLGLHTFDEDSDDNDPYKNAVEVIVV